MVNKKYRNIYVLIVTILAIVDSVWDTLIPDMLMLVLLVIGAVFILMDIIEK